MSFQVTKWLKFFKDAGIPSGHATNYAMTFCDHRIQDSMLPDLNKEILKDMNITVMGDIISILKHAKEVHAQSEREKMASQMPTEEPAVPSDTPPNTAQTLAGTETPPGGKRKAAAASQMVDHWISNVRASTGTKEEIDDPAPPVKLTIQVSGDSNSNPAVKTMSLSERFSAAGVGGKKIKVSSPIADKLPKKIITVKKKAAAAGVSKAKSVKFKQSVFERLGDEVPSSTTVTLKGNHDGKETAVMKQAQKHIDTSQKVKGTSSVFSRLGDKTEPSSLATTVRVMPILKKTQLEHSDKEKEDDSSVVDYISHSVLNPPKSSHSSKLVSDSITNSPKPVKQVKPVKRTVGIVSSTTDTNKTPVSSRSVFARLGSKV